jgi:TetR/AcrR family transcriptional repressor of nem operon
MRVSQEEMDKSHRRIVEGAARLFRERGIESTSVADVMSAAGLTQGGFYRHFESKNALLSAALASAFAQLKATMDSKLRSKNAPAELADYHSYYLSKEHLAQPGSACPVAMLAGDVARATPALKKQFGEGVKQIVGAVARAFYSKKKEAHAAAIRDFALLVGAAVIARASDPDTANVVLAACRPSE